jgi:hypothetical protein
MLITKNPTLNTTPDLGQGGLAVTGNINTGHGSTIASQVGSGSQTKTCIWTTFGAGPGGQIASALLKFDWTEDGAIANNGTNNFLIQYSIDGGSNWITIFTHTDVISSTSSSSQVTLPVGQNIGLVQVRDRLRATGSGIGDSASLTGSISNIRIEITTLEEAVVSGGM